jgi:hypothetical protein
MQTHITAQSYGWNSLNHKTKQTRLHGLYRAAEYSISRTPDDERNGRLEHVELYKIVE